MGILHAGTGAALFGVNSITPVIPGHATGDMMLLLVAGKPHDSGWSVATTGWASLGEFSPGTVAAGVDVGSMKVEAWWKQATSGAETNPTVTEGTPTWNVVGAIIVVFSKTAGEVWSTPQFVGGGDLTVNTAFSVTCNADPGITVDDHCVSYAGYASDGATPCSSHITPTATGVTFTNTHDPATDPESSSGGDMGVCVTRSTVTGTSSAAPVLTATLAANAEGAAGLVRLRATTPPPATAQGAAMKMLGLGVESYGLGRIA